MSTLHLADIFTQGYEHYCKEYGVTSLNQKVARAITSCRTDALGGRLYQCPSCETQVPVYNSCRNRHCPRCQSGARKKWVQSREEELLPVSYFHAVFTVPSQLRPFALRNKKAFYSILFRSVNETLKQLSATSRYLGASIGFIAVLHTWGQNLMNHPHIHCIIPAGGLSRSGKNWIPCKNLFLFPFGPMKKLFLSKVLDYFKQGLADGSITLTGTLTKYSNAGTLRKLLNQLYKTKWVIYVKQPFASPVRVIKYLGNYTHRVALSESRLVHLDTKGVVFTYKDYTDDARQKEMRLDSVEFIRRFLLHVLPSGFMRIRHYGILSNSNRKKNRQQCERIFTSMTTRKPKKQSQEQRITWYDRIEQETGVNPLLCKKCQKAVMVSVLELSPQSKKGLAYATDP